MRQLRRAGLPRHIVARPRKALDRAEFTAFVGQQLADRAPALEAADVKP
jgi:hypothetical protein